jgi:hypothetical protein
LCRTFQIDNFGRFDLKRFKFDRGERDELAALVLVAFDDFLALDLLPGMRVVRVKGDAGGGRRFRLCLFANILDKSMRCPPEGAEVFSR